MSNAPALSHITDWVFDVDNTLYPRTCNLFAQIDTLITKYVMQATGLAFEPARKMQKDYYRDHGTTLNGLMLTRGIDPDHYLSFVHDIDYSPVDPHPELVAAIKALPGRKFVFTNADNGHAANVLKRLGGADLFDGMFDIRATGFKPKPERSAYELCFETFGIDPTRAIMFDDLEKNLKVPHEMGLATVHVLPAGDFVHDQVDAWELNRADNREHVHHVTDNLVDFLESLLPAPAAQMS
ncbi:pyrimidine 5'-nucleotidase [Mariluticola halotolerans]|uniref:pyrimidine 5'-nucleotidase n=1 Tax=Mariluticola halotolerans TaxID=2909283 RepID=UPI0026E44040|nr:pyrimidine 5'-nucleotidase [Mariluticola halotolerans]UJQ93137.1 pyrimidine 5'-nucleotidase [Mariluticola halotolerans]